MPRAPSSWSPPWPSRGSSASRGRASTASRSGSAWACRSISRRRGRIRLRRRGPERSRGGRAPFAFGGRVGGRRVDSALALSRAERPMPTDTPELLEPDLWCPMTDGARRELLARAIFDALRDAPGVTGARIEVGPVKRPYDYTAVVETDVGDLRTPL